MSSPHSPALHRARVAPLLLLGSVLAACGSQETTAPEPRPVRSIVVVPAVDGAATRYTAEIRSRYETDLSFQVGGKVIARNVDAGDSVRRGAVLAQLDATDQRLGVDAARSALLAARAELERARTEEGRYRELLERGLTTRASYLAQETAVKTAQSRLEQAGADLRLNEQRLAYTTLRADQDGVVTRVSTEAGAVVSAGQRMFSIARPSELEAVFDVPDAHIEEVRRAAAMHMALLDAPDARYLARVREISPTADPLTRTYQVRTSLVNPPPALRLGMTVEITFADAPTQSILALPSTALFQQGRDPAVWIVKADETIELRPVRIERYESDRIVIAAGLSAGERVVTAGVHRLAAGEKVRLLEGAQR